MKFVDTSGTIAKGVASGQWSDRQLLSGIAQGDDLDQRNGRKACLTSLQLRVTSDFKAADPVNDPISNYIFRYIIFWDKNPNQATPAVTDVVAVNSSTTFKQLDNRQRFKILRDQMRVIEPPAQVGTDFGIRLHIEEFVRLVSSEELKYDVIFDSTGDATIASINQGALFFMYNISISDPSGTAGVYAGVQDAAFRSRVSFYDS